MVALCWSWNHLFVKHVNIEKTCHVVRYLCYLLGWHVYGQFHTIFSYIEVIVIFIFDWWTFEILHGLIGHVRLHIILFGKSGWLSQFVFIQQYLFFDRRFLGWLWISSILQRMDSIKVHQWSSFCARWHFNLLQWNFVLYLLIFNRRILSLSNLSFIQFRRPLRLSHIFNLCDILSSALCLFLFSHSRYFPLPLSLSFDAFDNQISRRSLWCLRFLSEFCYSRRFHILKSELLLYLFVSTWLSSRLLLLLELILPTMDCPIHLFDLLLRLFLFKNSTGWPRLRVFV